mgnify:CR=1 FL=1
MAITAPAQYVGEYKPHTVNFSANLETDETLVGVVITQSHSASAVDLGIDPPTVEEGSAQVWISSVSPYGTAGYQYHVTYTATTSLDKILVECIDLTIKTC